jgi:hypothetical protein
VLGSWVRKGKGRSYIGGGGVEVFALERGREGGGDRRARSCCGGARGLRGESSEGGNEAVGGSNKKELCIRP